MITLLVVFLVAIAACLWTWWYEEGGHNFAPPVPLPKRTSHRFPENTWAGYKPPRRKHAVR